MQSLSLHKSTWFSCVFWALLSLVSKGKLDPKDTTAHSVNSPLIIFTQVKSSRQNLAVQMVTVLLVVFHRRQWHGKRQLAACHSIQGAWAGQQQQPNHQVPRVSHDLRLAQERVRARQPVMPPVCVSCVRGRFPVQVRPAAPRQAVRQRPAGCDLHALRHDLLAHQQSAWPCAGQAQRPGVLLSLRVPLQVAALLQPPQETLPGLAAGLMITHHSALTLNFLVPETNSCKDWTENGSIGF